MTAAGPWRLLGVDVGGSSIKMGAVEVAGRPRVLARDTLRGHREDLEETMEVLAGRLRELAQEAGWEDFQGVGIGVPGLVRRDEGVLELAPNLAAWNGRNVVEPLQRRLERPVRIDNDANAFALAEWLWGAGEGCSDAVFLTLGTGIGGGIVAGGRMVRGRPGFASEPGHIPIERGGIPCPCGSRGCAERYVGIQALVDGARAHPGFGEDPHLRGNAQVTPKDLAEAARAGSPVARDVWESAGAALGVLLVGLTNMLNPERIVCGGGLSQAGDLILEPARRVLAERSLVARHAPPALLEAALGTEAGLLGAAGLFVEGAGTTEGR